MACSTLSNKTNLCENCYKFLKIIIPRLCETKPACAERELRRRPSRPSAIGYRLSVIGYQLSAISYRLSVIAYQLSPIQGKARLREELGLPPLP